MKLRPKCRSDSILAWSRSGPGSRGAAKPNGIASLLRRVALLSSAVIVISTLAAVLELKQSQEQSNDFTNEFAIADTAIQDEFSQ
jgi:hypothetical protein